METISLYRPVNQAELDLIAELGWKGFPPRLPEQPFFYPVMNEEYAKEISIKWNIPAYGVGYVLKWEINKDYVSKYKIENVGGHHHNELWIPAEELEEFNAHIVGKIELIGEYK